MRNIMDDHIMAYRKGTMPSYQSGTTNTHNPYRGMTLQQARAAGYGGSSNLNAFEGVAGGNVSGGGTPQLPYQPGAPRTQNLINQLSTAGQGFLDPNSDYARRLREQMVQGIGQQSAAQGRGAVLQASRAGFGSGAGAELLETQGDISRAGLAAQGQAGADLTLRAPQMGAQLLNPALQGQLGLQRQSLQAYMGQQQLEAQLQQQAYQAQFQQQQLEQERLAREAQMQFEMQLREMGYYNQ
jgi:hypothetical protein